VSRGRTALLATFALGTLCGGCAEVQYGSTTTHDQVLHTGERLVRGQGIVARAWQDRTELRVQAAFRCDLVEWNQIRRTTVEEADSDLTSDYVLLGLSAVPLGVGVALLADSGNVYDADRNARLYNQAGPTGAIAGGVILAAAGAVLAAVPVVDMVRASGSKEEESMVEERGRTLRADLSCSSAEPAAAIGVLGVIPGEAPSHQKLQFRLGVTDPAGRLTVDLADVLPSETLHQAGQPRSMQVVVGGRVIGLVDLVPVLLAMADRDRVAEDELWRQAGADACRQQPSEESCAGVRAYLLNLPHGRYAAEAEELLKVPPKKAVIAVEPGQGPPRPAIDEARKAVKRQCEQSCTRSCKKKADCVTACIAEICP
jgi:hypothetical protein